VPSAAIVTGIKRPLPGGERHGHNVSGGLAVGCLKENRMKNVEMKVDGDILTIKVNLTKDYGPSSSGKTIIIASTEGNVSIPDREEKVGLNVYRKKPS
jgi:hypothetical protein